MINWFVQQDTTVKAAIITGIASIIVAIIAGIFKLIELWIIGRRKKNEMQVSNVNITQSTTGNSNTFIGIQNNRKE